MKAIHWGFIFLLAAAYLLGCQFPSFGNSAISKVTSLA